MRDASRRLTPIPAPAPTVSGALERVVDAAQHVIVDQLDLIRLEMGLLVRHLLQGGALLMLGSLFLVVAWGALNLAAYVLLGDFWGLSVSARLGIIGGFNGAIGTVLLIAAFSQSGELTHGSS